MVGHSLVYFRSALARPGVKLWARRIATTLFFGAVIVMLGIFAQRVEWREVGAALQAFNAKTLLLAAAVALGGYLLYSTFDLFGRRYTGHHLPRPLVMTIGFISYAFTQSLTAWVGGIAMRYRLYSRYGLDKSAIAQIFGISILTNWIGFLLLIGILCLAGGVTLPANWPISTATIRVVGPLFIVPVILYLWFCYRFPNQRHHAFGADWYLPTLTTGVLQVIAGAANWGMMAAILFVLLQQQVDYFHVLAIVLLSSIAAVIIHIPAGLGVLEATFIALLHGIVKQHQVLAVMICYRAVYYLAPLLIAIAVYIALEMRSARVQKTEQPTS